MSDFTNLNYYRPSGTAPAGGVVLTLAGGLAAAAALGCVYGYANYHDPILYLNALLVFGFGAALGWLLALGVRRFRIRNAAIVVAVALPVFALAYATHWLSYVATAWADLDEVPWHDFGGIFEIAKAFAMEPEAFAEFVKQIFTHGLWTITSSSSRSSGTEVNGLFLLALWAGEFAGILFWTVKIPLAETRKPYSERADAWIAPRQMALPVAFVDNLPALKSALARNDYSALTSPLESEACDGQKHAVVTLYDDPFDAYVSLHNVTVKGKKNKKNAEKKDISKKEVLRYLKISPAVAQSILSALGGNAALGA